MQDSSFNQKIADIYRTRLQYTDTSHEKIFIIFSGTPGSGKTTLAKKLTDDLQAQYVRHDEIRQIIKGIGHDPHKMSMIPISKLIIDDIMAYSPNKLVILDASLDRAWNIYFDHVRRLEAKPCIIRFEVPKKILVARLNSRNDDGDEKLVKMIDTFIEQLESCKKSVNADICLGVEYKYEEVLSKIKNLYGLS